jgi:nucleotide-binding universal stress UspA family protein
MPKGIFAEPPKERKAQMKPFAKLKAGTQEPSAGAGRSKTGVKSQSLFRTRNEALQPKWELRNILVPIDFSEPSKKALSYALSFAKQNGGRITLLHVIEPIFVYPDAVYPVMMDIDLGPAGAKKAFRKLCKEEHVDRHLVRNMLIRRGTPHQEIAQAARELEADLIIIATNGYTGLAHVLLGSTTERVVRHAPCPVLVVREKEREFLRR